MRKIVNSYSGELFKGVVSVAGMRIVGVFIGYLFVLLAARTFGATSLGQYQLAVQLIGTCVMLSALGFNQLALKYSSRVKGLSSTFYRFRKLLKQWVGITLFAALIFSVMLYSFSEYLATRFFGDESAEKYIFIVSVLVPLQVVSNLFVEIFRGMGLISLSEYLRSIHVRAMALVLLIIMTIQIGKNDILMIASYAFATISSFFLVIFFAYKKIIRIKEVSCECESLESEFPLKESLRQSFPMYQSAILIFSSTQALIYILAYFESPAEVAKYTVCLQVASLASFVFASVVTVSAPMYSRDYMENKEKLKRTIFESSRMIFWTSGTVSLVIAVCSYPILRVFGEEFSDSWPVLVVLSAANFVNAFTGASGNLLDMTGSHRARKNILFINAVLTIIVAFFAIKSFGVIGVAVGYFVNMCFGNFVCLYFAYKRVGINMMYVPGVSKIS